MTDKEQEWDRLLKIRTTGRDATHADQYKYPYEPTPYSVLEQLAHSGFISKKDVLLDYGSGKGRVEFFLSYQTRCKCIGVEYDSRLYESAVRNQENTVCGGRITFVLQKAERFDVPTDVNRIFFFNPFSLELLKSVMGRIRQSLYEVPRELLLFFYYPSDEYISWLMTVDEIGFSDEIDCRDLFPGEDKRERIMIFETTGISH